MEFAGRVAVVTGGGTGMGRELVRQLAAAGCHVATCDVSDTELAETARLARAEATGGARVATGRADVADLAAIERFRDAAIAELGATCVHLLFNNAGIAGGGSFVRDDKDEWDRVFSVDFFGVVNTTRAFLDLLLAADEGRVVNTSSINGIWASLGPAMPHTAYSAAKFAVKGFSEALICDFRVNAPHLSVSVVHPGHVGTSIVLNTAAAHGRDAATMTSEQLDEVRRQFAGLGLDQTVSDEDLRKGIQLMGEAFRDHAPVTAGEAATTILDGVRAGRWRILVGDDAVAIDKAVREDPEGAYEPEFFQMLRDQGHFGAFGV